MMELDPVEGWQREKSLQIMMELDPVEGKTKGDKPRDHDGTGSSRRETKGDKLPNHDGTKPFSLNELRTHQLKLFGEIYVTCCLIIINTSKSSHNKERNLSLDMPPFLLCPHYILPKKKKKKRAELREASDPVHAGVPPCHEQTYRTSGLTKSAEDSLRPCANMCFLGCFECFPPILAVTLSSTLIASVLTHDAKH